MPPSGHKGVCEVEVVLCPFHHRHVNHAAVYGKRPASDGFRLIPSFYDLSSVGDLFGRGTKDFVDYVDLGGVDGVLLGRYMACWPKVKGGFPLLVLIRAWPVWLMVFIRLGLEVWQMYELQVGTAGESNIAHMAHVGGFFLAYILARPIARGAPSSLDSSQESAAGSGRAEAIREQAKERMGSLDDDPWAAADKPLQGGAARILRRKWEEGDELETRGYWGEGMEEQRRCRVCDGGIVGEMRRGSSRLSGALVGDHVKWP